MSQKSNGTPGIDLSAFAGLFSPNSKALGLMGGNPFMSQSNGTAPGSNAAGAIAGGSMNLQPPITSGAPGMVPRNFFNGGGRPNITSPMRQNMMGSGSPFFPYQL